MLRLGHGHGIPNVVQLFYQFETSKLVKVVKTLDFMSYSRKDRNYFLNEFPHFHLGWNHHLPSCSLTSY